MNDRSAYVVLNALGRIGPVRVRALVERFGSPAAILGAKRNELTSTPGVGPEAAASILAWREGIDPDREEERARSLGVHIVVPCDPDYPARLREIHDPPLALYVRGSLADTDRHAIAIVGSRRSTVYGRSVAGRLAAGLSRCGLTVVSGLARGIDTEAHEGALRGRGRTLAVMGCGQDTCYPAENRDLASRIASSGAVLSEFPLGTPPDRSNFPMRNRIISGLSLGVIVVEAGDRSGALITADEALEQGRSVFAVPGRVDSPASRGTHRLIKQGARLVDSIEDVLDEFEWLFRPAEPAAQPAMIQLDDDERLVYDAVGDDATPIDEVIRATGLKSGRVSSILLGLEVRRLIRQLPGKLFARRSSTPQPPSANPSEPSDTRAD